MKWNGGPNAGPNVAWSRQSLPPIIWNGRLNPALNDSSQWGFTVGNAVRVWRTGVGIDRRGNLIFAAADDQTVITLARILQRAGAVRAMQFDINADWHTLITYTHHHGLVPRQVGPIEPAHHPLPKPRRPRLLRRLPTAAWSRHCPLQLGIKQASALHGGARGDADASDGWPRCQPERPPLCMESGGLGIPQSHPLST